MDDNPNARVDEEVADLLKKYLDDYSGRVSALAIKDMGSLSSMNMDAKRP